MLYLGGGGDEVEEAKLWDRAFKSGQHVTVWPFAQPREEWNATVEWVANALAPRGDFTVSLGDSANKFGLPETDIVAITGGNTFDLLAYMQEHGLVKAIKEFVAGGGLVYGGSAGAILIGADIGIADVKVGGLDPNNVSLEDTKGLNYLGGWDVYPHYSSINSKHYSACQRWASGHSVVVGVPETCGISVDGKGNAYNAGPSDVTVFKPNGEAIEWKAGETWVLGPTK